MRRDFVITSGNFTKPGVATDEYHALSTVGIDYVILNPIELELITFQIWIINDSDYHKEEDELQKIDALAVKKVSGIVSLLNLVAALGYVHLLKWCITADDRICAYPASRSDNDIRALLCAIDFNCSMDFRDNFRSDYKWNEDYPEPRLTAFITATLFGQLEVVQYFLDLKYDIKNEEKYDMSLFHGLRNTLYQLMGLCVFGHLKGVQFLLKRGSMIDHQDRHGVTPLIIAAYHARGNIIKCLIENHADIHIKDNFGFFAVMYAATFNGRFDTSKTQYGIEHGMAFSGMEDFRIALQNPETLAIARRKLETIRLLLSHGDKVSAEDLQKLSLASGSLIEYSMESHIDIEVILRLLIENNDSRTTYQMNKK